MLRDETISVIMPVFNASAYVGEALESVFLQSAKPLEVLVVDDGSTDGSEKIVQEYPATLISQPNSGPAVARNRAMKMARGNFIAFIDADDFWPKDKLAMHMGHFRADPTLEVVIGSLQVWVPSEREGSLGFTKFGVPAAGVNLGAGVYRRSLIERMGGLTPEYFSEDMDLYLRLRESGARMKQVAELALNYRLHNANMTANSAQTIRSTMLMLKRSINRRRGKPLPPIEGEQE